MAAKYCLCFLLTLTSLMARFTSSSSREFDPIGLMNQVSSEVKDDEALDCFSALYKIKSCSDEIVAYFSKGSIDITHPCCEAINMITHHCWPALLTTLGYGPDQIGILRGYCDAVGRGFGPIASPLGPVQSPFGLPPYLV